MLCLARDDAYVSIGPVDAAPTPSAVQRSASIGCDLALRQALSGKSGNTETYICKRPDGT